MRLAVAAAIVVITLSLTALSSSGADSKPDANRLAYLADVADPYYVNRDFPKLTTPQWVGEEGVKAVVVLAIDDMRDPQKYETFCRPILDRLKQIDGRAHFSIMTCDIDPKDPRLQALLKEGVSLEVHTVDHPCPLLGKGDFAKAKSTYERCVDMMSAVPGNAPVAFRTPCCDSLNTVSPRFFREMFNKTTEAGHFLQMDSSVFNVTTPKDTSLPRDLTVDADGKERFRKYLPFERFVITIDDYPYPYLIGRRCWEFPCAVPSDWEGQNLLKPANPKMLEDWKASLDATVIKEGVFTAVFHPYGWSTPQQWVEFIDYAQTTYGKAVKFLSFKECLERINKNLLDGHPVRDEKGGDNGVRLIDLNGDGLLDVVNDDGKSLTARQWKPVAGMWESTEVPPAIAEAVRAKSKPDTRLVDLDDDGNDDLIVSNATEYDVRLFDPATKDFTRTVSHGKRGEHPSSDEIPPIVRADGTDNGFFVHSRMLCWQNEDTDKLPGLIDSRSFDDVLKDVRPGPKSPEQAMKTMHVRPGFQIEQVAAEPLTMDPVAYAWGPDGKFWVVEMGDYPLGMDGHGEPGGIVRVLTDTDGDGKYDKSTVFLDHLRFPNGVTPYRKGVLITAAPDLIYAEDTNSDGKADKVEVLFTGYREGNQQHRFNGLVYGLDNWFYGADGESGGVIKSTKTGKTVDLGRGKDFRCRPDTGEIETETAGTQFGRTRDDWGNWFGCNNSNPNYHFVLSERYLKRSPLVGKIAEPTYAVPQIAGAAPVFPVSKTVARFNDFDMAGRITSANSICIYRDELFGPEFVGNSFVSEPVHNLVHREVMQPHGVTFRSVRAPDEQNSEFFASTDGWCRPTQLKTGPYGALWVADMYRETIEHPEWIPLDWQKKLDLRAGHDKGRIYRIYPAGAKLRPIPRLADLDAAGLVAALDSPNGWQRDTAQQLLVERQDKSAAPLLEKMVTQNTRPLARLHALCTLDGLGMLSEKTLLAALNDRHSGVIRQAIVIAESRINDSGALLDALARLTSSTDAKIRLQLALTLGARSDDRAVHSLAALVDGDLYVSAAIVSGLRPDRVKPFLREFREGGRGRQLPPEVSAAVAQIAGGAGDGESVAEVVTVAAGDLSQPREANFGAVAELLDDLEGTGASLSKLAANAKTAESLRKLDPLFAAARQLANDASTPDDKRAAAIRLLYRGPDKRDDDLVTLIALTSPQSAPVLRSAAVESLGRIGTPAAIDPLVKGWRSYGPGDRALVLDALLNRREGTQALLAALSSGAIAPRDVDLERRQRLLRSSNRSVRKRVDQIFASEVVNKDRQKVIEAFAPALSLTGDGGKGKPLFEKLCASCHKLGDVGHAVGPDLAGLTDPSPTYLLTHVLDPNRAVEARYVNYVVETSHAQTYSGILAGEAGDSVTILQANGLAQTVARADLKQMRSTGLSLMPEGLETGLAPQDLADLMAFVASRAPAPTRKLFKGNEPQLVKAGADGAIRLTAQTAEIYGPRIELEEKYANLGYWENPSDHVVWQFEAAKAGKYTVWLEFACDDNSAGNTLAIEDGASRLTVKVPSTGSWDRYRKQQVGEIRLRGGKQRITFKPEGKPDGAMIDLKAVELMPE